LRPIGLASRTQYARCMVWDARNRRYNHEQGRELDTERRGVSNPQNNPAGLLLQREREQDRRHNVYHRSDRSDDQPVHEAIAHRGGELRLRGGGAHRKDGSESSDKRSANCDHDPHNEDDDRKDHISAMTRAEGFASQNGQDGCYDEKDKPDYIQEEDRKSVV